MRVVGRTVERVDDPLVRGVGAARLQNVAGLLGENRVPRVVAAYALDYQLLGREVGLGHEVDVALVRHLQGAPELVGQNLPGLTRDLDSEIKHSVTFMNCDRHFCIQPRQNDAEQPEVFTQAEGEFT